MAPRPRRIVMDPDRPGMFMFVKDSHGPEADLARPPPQPVPQQRQPPIPPPRPRQPRISWLEPLLHVPQGQTPVPLPRRQPPVPLPRRQPPVPAPRRRPQPSPSPPRWQPPPPPPLQQFYPDDTEEVADPRDLDVYQLGYWQIPTAVFQERPEIHQESQFDRRMFQQPFPRRFRFAPDDTMGPFAEEDDRLARPFVQDEDTDTGLEDTDYEDVLPLSQLQLSPTYQGLPERLPEFDEVQFQPRLAARLGRPPPPRRVRLGQRPRRPTAEPEQPQFFQGQEREPYVYVDAPVPWTSVDLPSHLKEAHIDQRARHPLQLDLRRELEERMAKMRAADPSRQGRAWL